jgi:hypothetical protein
MGGMMQDPIESADHGCLKSESDQMAELMTSQSYSDRQVLERVRRGETTHKDFLYLCGRLNYNVENI